MNKVLKIKSLVEELNIHRDAYYNDSFTWITDKEYDEKFDELKKLEEETGFMAGKLEFLISIKTTVAFCNENIDIYVARDLKSSKQNFRPAPR